MKKIFLIGFLIILGFMLTSFAQVQAQTPPWTGTITNPGVFVSETSSIAPDPLDPATNYETQGGGYIQMMYEGLYQYANNSLTQLAPSLALTHSVTTNGLVYTFTLRQGVTFSLQPGETTGQPFNAYVMAYSINRAILMNDPSGPAWMIQDWIKGASVLEGMDVNITQATTFLNQGGVKALDANTLQITLSAPFGGFLQTLQFPVAYAVSPKAIIDNKPFAYDTDPTDDSFGMVSLASMFPGMANATILSDLGLPSTYNIDNSGVVPSSIHTGPAAYTWLQSHSAGTGPYVLTNLIQGTEVDFTKNTNWWNKANFQANSVDKIKITQVPEDATRVLDLKNGKIDTGAIPFSSLGEFMDTTTKTVKPGMGVNAYVYDTIINGFIGMNMNNTLPSGQISEASGSNYSLGTMNYQNLQKFTWKDANGQPVMASPDNPISSVLFRQALAYSFPTDTYIKEALAGFGIRMQGAIPKGLLGYDSNLIANGNIPTYNPTQAKALFDQVGFKGSITLTYNTGSTGRKIGAQLLSEAVHSIDPDITINVATVAWNAFLTGSFGGADALFQLGWAPDFADPHDYTVPYYRTGGTFATSINYENPYVTKLVDQGAAATSDAARTSIYQQMEENATGDFPYIYVYQQQQVTLTRDWIQGINETSSNALNAMVNFLPLQNLAKGYWYAGGSSSNTSKASPGFELFAVLGVVLAVGVVNLTRKRRQI